MGVSVLEGTDFMQAVTGAGLVRIWETRRECGAIAAGLGQDAWRAQENEIYAREFAELGEEQANIRTGQRQGMRRLGEVFGLGHAPLWRVVSGMMSGLDLTRMHPNERAGRLTRLIRAVERVVRYEWRAFEKNAASRPIREEDCEEAATECANSEDAHAADDPRVRWWDPMRVVCEHFGIAYSTLSRFSRETAGLSASDLTDRVKAERVKTRMREDVKAWVNAIYAEEKANAESELHTATGDDVTEFLWSRVAIKRGRGRWSRSAWAVKFGYSSYTRFQRACLAQFGVTPVELERAVLEEIVEEQAKVRGQTSKVEELVEGNDAEISKDERTEGDEVVRSG